VTHRAERRAISPALIVLPSLVSGVGVGFILAAILVNQQVLQDIFLCLGVALLWADFFITMAIFRGTIRSIEARLRSIEERGSDR
jgi:hypothetical protein